MKYLLLILSLTGCAATPDPVADVDYPTCTNGALAVITEDHTVVCPQLHPALCLDGNRLYHC